MSHSVYIKGQRWVVCDRCGFDRRANEVSKEWTGFIVCTDTCLDQRNPQELRRDTVREEGKITGPVRPPPSSETFTDVTYADDGLGDAPSGTFNNEL
jgi:hypothetical protein